MHDEQVVARRSTDLVPPWQAFASASVDWWAGASVQVHRLDIRQQTAFADLCGRSRLPGEYRTFSVAGDAVYPKWPGPLSALDLDLMPSSDHERCTYAVLSGIGIHQVVNGDGDDAVTTARFTETAGIYARCEGTL
ncbi:hypothetical protein [Nocardia asiatica]|uniref:hypothetical protein n=1 Tax=Nocardia asiatica TaxID=209252 RepID=UPI002458F278|nr:hypothetical protein [Nocardia asiatica]